MSESLIGRDEELAELKSLLTNHRLVSVVGPGGVGKTTLASASVSGPRVSFIARLAPLSSSDLRDSIAGSLRFASYAEMARAFEGDSVLVLDNCEHVVDEVAEIAEELLDAHPKLRVLATSREPLGIPGERVVELPPLPILGDPSPAAELFMARMAERGVEIPEDLSDIDELCQRLDGLPLALELAAARTSGIAPGEMIEHLGSRLDLLGRTRGGPERHRSITATVGWSFQLLEDDLKELFLSLSVFMGSFNTRMAVAMAGAEEAARAADQLVQLVERSLLVHESVDGESWYRMLSTIRAYGAEKLEASGRWVEMNERMVDLAVDAAAGLSMRVGSQADPSAAHDLGRLFGVLRYSIGWCLEHDEEPDRVRTLVAPLWALEDIGFQGEAADTVGRIIQHWSLEDASTLGRFAHLSRSAGRFEEAGEAALRSIEVGGPGAEMGYRTLGLNARIRGEYDQAIEILMDGASVARQNGDEGFGFELEVHAGLAMARAGRVDDAVELFMRVAEEGVAFPMVTVIAFMFSAVALAGSDMERSLEMSRRAEEIAVESNYPWAIQHARQQLATGRYLEGDVSAGLNGMADTLAYFSEKGIRSETCLWLRTTASMFAAAGRHDLAGAAMRAARAEFGEPAVGPSEQAILDRISSDPVSAEGAPWMTVAEIIGELRLLAKGEEASPHRDANRFMRAGEVWDVTFAGQQALLAQTKGMVDLHELLSRPGQEVSSLDLMGAEVVAGDAGPVSDQQARRSYEERIRELQADVEEAEADNDPFRAEKATAELDALIDQLSAAYGLRGEQRTAHDVAEKARTAVTWRIRSAIKKVGGEIPALGDHLSRSVKTGRFCSYDPEAPVLWELR